MTNKNFKNKILHFIRSYERYFKYIVPMFLLIIIGSIWAWNVPTFIHSRVLHQIEILTGVEPLPETIEFKGNMIMLKNISLDHDGIETLDTLGIIFSPLSYFGIIKINSLLIDGSSFTREFNLPSKDMLERFNSLFLSNKIMTLAETIEIRNATFDVVTKNMGALRLRGEGLIRTDENTGLKSFQFTIDSKQKNFSMETRLAGSILPNHNWDGELNIDSLSAQIQPIHVLRSSGVFRIGGALDTYFIIGEANIGALDFSGYALKELAASIDITQDTLSWTLGGMALASETIEIGASYNSSESDLIQGSVYSQDLKALTHYLWPDTRESHLKSLSRFKDNFFTYAIRPSEIFKPAKSIRISTENFDLKLLADAFPQQIKQAEGLANLQFVATLDQNGVRTSKGILYTQDPGSLIFTRRGLRDILGRDAAKRFKSALDYQSFTIHSTGDILSEQAHWSINLLPQNIAEPIVFDLTRSASPLKDKVMQ